MVAKILWTVLLVIPVAGPSFAGNPLKPTSKDKCPVCGMFVSKYPTWIAQIHLQGGEVLFFDGAKDMFKFLLDPSKYGRSLRPQEIISIYVTDYYSLEPVEAREALYVIGSDVLGPMGRELIPFRNKEDALQFQKDHNAKAILTFGEIKGSTVKELDSR